MHASLPVIAALAALAPAQPVGISQTSPARVIAPAPVARGEACPPLSRHATGEKGTGARKLIDAPPVDLHLAVDRRENGCPVPALAGAPRR